jgi:hypothetical protein
VSGFGAACLLLVLIPPFQLPSPRRTDWLDALLITAGLGVVVFVLSGDEPANLLLDSRCFGFVPGMLIGFLIADIIAVEVTGISFLVIFILREHYLERVREHSNAVY